MDTLVVRVTFSSFAENSCDKQALFSHFLLIWGILKQSYVEWSCTNVLLRRGGGIKREVRGFGGMQRC